jgi:hypothetical protein
MLAGELAETAKDLIDQSPLPYFVGVLAAQLLSVVAQPLHLMYGKVNRFLNRGPSWTVTKLPSYWVDKILLNPPTEDDARYQEVEWLLDALVEGLRTPAVSIASKPALVELTEARTLTYIVAVAYLNDSCRFLHLHLCQGFARRNSLTCSFDVPTLKAAQRSSLGVL